MQKKLAEPKKADPHVDAALNQERAAAQAAKAADEKMRSDEEAARRARLRGRRSMLSAGFAGFTSPPLTPTLKP